MKDMKMIEDMVAKMMTGSHMGKKPKDEEEPEGETEDEEEVEVEIKFCGKDALKKAHDMLMASFSAKK